MVREKFMTPELNPPKKKKLSLDDSQVPTEKMQNKVKKKRKNMEVEEAPEQSPSVTNTTDDKTLKKDKKRKKRPVKEQTQTKQTEVPDPSSCSEVTHELDEEDDLSLEEKRILERKMKKILKKEEKKRLKDEGGATHKTETTGPSASQQALDYLTCWAEKRSVWKFQKTRQTWLLQHMFDSEKIPDDKFLVLLQYLEGLQGRAKDTTVQKALSLVEESGQAPEDTVVQQRAHRAREVIQLFS